MWCVHIELMEYTQAAGSRCLGMMAAGFRCLVIIWPILDTVNTVIWLVCIYIYILCGIVICMYTYIYIYIYIYILHIYSILSIFTCIYIYTYDCVYYIIYICPCLQQLDFNGDSFVDSSFLRPCPNKTSRWHPVVSSLSNSIQTGNFIHLPVRRILGWAEQCWAWTV